MGKHRRFVIDPQQISGENAVITGDTARQIIRVLRLREGDMICLLDGLGNEHSALITSTSKDSISTRILCTNCCMCEPTVRVTLVICLPKGDRLELIVQKCSELGISEYVVVHSERTVSRLDGAKAAERLSRWRKIAAEAVEQCGGARVPDVRGVIEFPEMVREIGNYDLALLAWEEEKSTGLKEVLRGNENARSVLVIIGPEGGLTEDEAALAKSAGAKCVTLGRRVLRSETAAIAASAVVMYELEGEL
ncbi:MAG: 16S rRNA (uracil(1498)-N(3))-methyltransferase [Armatimonadota bacterium]|nr:16S rRNA (uracil(1498)-N(3))-methyltransferase [bacterium]